jgi:hypothetical protein
MKMIHFLNSGSFTKLVLAAGLVTFGLETRLPAPPATPVPTYYSEDFGGGSFLDLVPIDLGADYEVGDWDIATPDGELTPFDSIIASGGDFTVPYFDNLYAGDFLDAITFDGTGPYTGEEWLVELGPVGASIADPDGGVSRGSWSIPDRTPTWLLLIAGAGVLCVGRKSRKFQAGA